MEVSSMIDDEFSDEEEEDIFSDTHSEKQGDNISPDRKLQEQDDMSQEKRNIR